MSWSTSELRVRLAPLNRFKPSSKIFYWPFQGGTSFVDLLCFCSVLCLLCFVRVCVYVLCGHLLGKGWPLGSRLCCLLWVCHFPIGILGQVWYLIVSFPDLCNLTYFAQGHNTVILVNLEPAAPLSQVKHSTTEPLPSHNSRVKSVICTYRIRHIHPAMRPTMHHMWHVHTCHKRKFLKSPKIFSFSEDNRILDQ